jgi:hypothetical protein
VQFRYESTALSTRPWHPGDARAWTTGTAIKKRGVKEKRSDVRKRRRVRVFTVKSHRMAAPTKKLLSMTFPEGTTFNKGVPAETPAVLVDAIKRYCNTHPVVKTVRLGLVEFMPPRQSSVFCYVIGLECDSDASIALADCRRMALFYPEGRWPVMIVDYMEYAYLFSAEAITIFTEPADPGT